jgi:dTDP-4-dehydrorhamnose reductase
MSVLVFGQTGQVARALGAHPGTHCLSRARADLSDPRACAAVIRAQAPVAVINAAAWTNVDGAEEHEAQATVINAEAPGAMAAACAALDIPFVTLSTDYVFDGTGTRPRAPGDPTGPLNAYGRSKLAGERAVARAGGRWAVLRTSWVVSGQGANFIAAMLRLGRSRDALSVVADQRGGPTPADALAAACLRLARTLETEPDIAGIYHLSGAPDTSWADFARAIFEVAGLACTVTDIATAEYPTAAVRPLNSRLDCARLETILGIKRPDWRASLPAMIAALERAGT